MPESRPVNRNILLLTTLARIVKSCNGSGAGLADDMLAASKPDALMIPRVLPSGSASRMAMAATTPPAAAWFSITI